MLEVKFRDNCVFILLTLVVATSFYHSYKSLSSFPSSIKQINLICPLKSTINYKLKENRSLLMNLNLLNMRGKT